MNPVMIIAEAGVNHNGSVDMARQLVRIAARAGAHVVKFQTFITEACITSQAGKAEYQKEKTGAAESQFEMVKKLELSFDAFEEIRQECVRCGILFCSTPFDLPSVDFLHRMKMPFWKIPSGEITNLPYLRKIGAFGQAVILSTGMSELFEIGEALAVLEQAGTPRGKITLLHCNTEYPTPIQDVNLNAMNTLREKFPGLKGVGYSDHTLGIEVPIAAVAMGATVIEKHFTLDKTLPGPDHPASLEPDELEAMVQAIRNVERALGDGGKKPTPSEIKNKPIARKSIVAAEAIVAGETFSDQNITVKRPGTGISPMRWDEIVGQKATHDYQKDDLIDA